MRQRSGAKGAMGPSASFGNWGDNSFGKLLPFMSSSSTWVRLPRSPQCSASMNKSFLLNVSLVVFHYYEQELGSSSFSPKGDYYHYD